MGSEHFGRTRRDRALSPAERADARAALQILVGSGLSLAAAARRAVEGRAALRRISVEDTADLFLRAKLPQVRPQTWSWFEQRLGPLRDAFGTRSMDEVSRADFRAWLTSLAVGEATRTGYVRAARALWRWAAAQEPPLAGPPPTSGLSGAMSTKGRTVGFLRVEEAAAILAEASPWRPALALMLFAGLRVEELAGQGKPPLLWRAIDVEGRTLRVPAEIAKTGRARLLQDLPPTVWAWLYPRGGDAERVCPGQSVNAVRWAKARVERPWPANALRHTFATYAVALTGEPDRVAGWLGHLGGSNLLHGHYAGLARRAEGEAFFALRPDQFRDSTILVRHEKAPAD
jgi:integrase